jgi:hypothetical protein
VTRISLSTSVFPCHYHSTIAPYSSSPTCCSYQKDKWAKIGNLPEKAMLFRKYGVIGQKSTFTLTVRWLITNIEFSCKLIVMFLLSRCVPAVSRYAKLLSQPDVGLYNHLRGVAVSHGNLHSLTPEVNILTLILKLKQSAIPTVKLTL